MAGTKQTKGTGARRGRPVATVKRGQRIDRLDRRATPPKGAGNKGGGWLRGRRPLYWLAVAGLWTGIVICAMVAFFAWDLPSMDRLNQIDRRPAVRLVAADGTTFATVGDLYGDALALDQYPDVLVKAVLAIEDRRFFDHGGFDPLGILRAMFHNIMDGRVTQGGSTISQQTAKNVFLWPGRGWIRKGLEAGYTVLIEAIWPKRRIVEVYLNVAEMGPGVYGAEAAARHWFGKSASELTRTEAARLAAILPNPREYNAGSPGPYVRRRTQAILANMGTIRAEGLSNCVA